MRRTTLGQTDLTVSELCLGSMTWGSQDSQENAFEQIDMALERGVDFIDTAEMYPVNPVAKATVGRTETVIGNWVAQSGRRDDVVLATKVSGLNGSFVREGQPINGKTMKQALEGSLKRLKTDYVDLYQLHWPNRGSFHFRQIWDFDPSGQSRSQTRDGIADVLKAMTELQAEGKVRHFGLSNESTWGTMTWLQMAEELGAPRMATMQNEYSLLCRQYDSDLAEMSVNEDVTLLAFSPLGVGMLTDKYKGGTVVPDGSRMAVAPDLGGRVSPRVWPAVAAYSAIAKRHGLDPTGMAIAWCLSRPFKTIPIYGARSTSQMEQVLAGAELTLSDEVLKDISAAHRAHPMPY